MTTLYKFEICDAGATLKGHSRFCCDENGYDI